MSSDKKAIPEWFGYTRRERRSAFILFLLLLIAIGARYLVPPKDIELEDLSGLLTTDNSRKVSPANISSVSTKLFLFDPNSVSYDSLTLLGLSETQARTLVNYRNKGGRFLKPEDIKKIYGLDESDFARLIPYVNIEKNREKNTERNTEKSTERGGYSMPATFSDRKKKERIELNSCDSAALDRLPGLGPVLSARIIKYRKLLGGFVSVEQLKEVYGLADSIYIRLSGRVYADSSRVKGIIVNDSGFRELSRHPYLDKYEVQAILKYKELKGTVSDIGELVDNKVLTAGKAKKLNRYLIF
jgi:competence protein ComEA